MKIKRSPRPIAAQEVAVKPSEEPWLSLAVPPAWIIHLRRHVGNDDDNGMNDDDDDDDDAPDGKEEEGSPLFAAQALGEENLVEKVFFSILSLS